MVALRRWCGCRLAGRSRPSRLVDSGLGPYWAGGGAGDAGNGRLVHRPSRRCQMVDRIRLGPDRAYPAARRCRWSRARVTLTRGPLHVVLRGSAGDSPNGRQVRPVRASACNRSAERPDHVWTRVERVRPPGNLWRTESVDLPGRNGCRLLLDTDHLLGRGPAGLDRARLEIPVQSPIRSWWLRSCERWRPE